MKKGSEDESIIAYVHGRIDKELETFASSLGVQTSYLSTRIGALLLTSRTGMESNLPSLRPATSKERSPLESVERIEHARHASTWRKSAKRKSSSKAPKNKVASKKKPLSSIKKYWAKFTPEQRKKIMAARHAKWSAAAKASWGKGKRAA